MITIILIDFHSITRAGVLSILGEVPEFKIIGIGQNENEFDDLLKQFHPTIVLLDFQSILQKKGNSEELDKFIKPSIKTLVLNAENYQAYISTFFNLGVSGILEKNVTDDELIINIKKIAEGGFVFSQDQINQMHIWEEIFIEKWKELTHRERQILELVSKGDGNKQIAFALEISIKTVSFHISNIFLKLGLNSRQEITQWFDLFISNRQGNLPG